METALFLRGLGGATSAPAITFADATWTLR
jgi:hypothetical protein